MTNIAKGWLRSAMSKASTASRSQSLPTCRAKAAHRALRRRRRRASGGQALRLDTDPKPGDATRVQLPHPELIQALMPGSEILLDDGRVRLRVTRQGNDHLDTTVVSGLALSDRKGVNVPGVVLPLVALTPKDRADLTAALSFVSIGSLFLSFSARPT